MAHTALRTIVACASRGATCFLPWNASALPAGVDAKAARLPRAMAMYLAGLQKFSVETENSLEAVTTEGPKIPFMAPAAPSFQGPDKLVAKRRGDVADQALRQCAEPRFVSAEQPRLPGAEAVNANAARRVRHVPSAASAPIGNAALPGSVEQAHRSCSEAFAVSDASPRAVVRIDARPRMQFW